MTSLRVCGYDDGLIVFVRQTARSRFDR